MTDTLVIQTCLSGRYFLENEQRGLSLQGRQLTVFIANNKMSFQTKTGILENLYLPHYELNSFEHLQSLMRLKSDINKHNVDLIVNKLICGKFI